MDDFLTEFQRFFTGKNAWRRCALISASVQSLIFAGEIPVFILLISLIGIIAAFIIYNEEDKVVCELSAILYTISMFWAIKTILDTHFYLM